MTSHQMIAAGVPLRVAPQGERVVPMAYPSQKEADYYGLAPALRAVLAVGAAKHP